MACGAVELVTGARGGAHGGTRGRCLSQWRAKEGAASGWGQSQVGQRRRATGKGSSSDHGGFTG